MSGNRTLKEKIWGFALDGMWTEGIRLLFAYWRAWIMGAAGFALVQICADYFFMHAAQPGGAQIANFVLSLAETWFFTTCLLHQEPVTGNVEPTFPQFARTALYTAAISAVALAGFTAALYVAGILLRGAGADPAQAAMRLLREAAGFAVLLLIFARLALAVPLAANAMENPLPASWRLTRGKTRRMCANLLLLALLLKPVEIWIDEAGIVALGSAYFVLENAIFAAFGCAAARILYGEAMAAKYGERRTAARD